MEINQLLLTASKEKPSGVYNYNPTDSIKKGTYQNDLSVASDGRLDHSVGDLSRNARSAYAASRPSRARNMLR